MMLFYGEYNQGILMWWQLQRYDAFLWRMQSRDSYETTLSLPNKFWILFVLLSVGALYMLHEFIPITFAHCVRCVSFILINSSHSSAAYMSLNQVSIGSDTGSSPIRRRATIWTSAWLLLTAPLGIKHQFNVNQNKKKITKMHLKISSAERLSCCPGGIWVKDGVALAEVHLTD